MCVCVCVCACVCVFVCVCLYVCVCLCEKSTVNKFSGVFRILTNKRATGFWTANSSYDCHIK